MVEPSLSGITELSTPDAQRFKALVESSLDAIFLTDFDSAQFVEVNQKACQLFGYSTQELTGKSGRQLHPPSAQVAVDEMSAELIRNGQVWRPSVRLQRKDGTEFSGELRSHCYTSGPRTFYITFVRDLSAEDSRERELQDAYRHLRETQDQLVHTARLAAVGQLAAGIAHEVNNPTAYVFSNLEGLFGSISQLAVDGTLAQTESVERFITESKENLNDCLEGLGRIAAIVRSLKAFTRIDRNDVTLTNINDVVHSAVELLKPQTRHIAQVVLDLNCETQLVADRGKLVQVIVNLIMNAAQAVKEAKGSIIQVSTYDDDKGIILRVEDDGFGVPKHAVNHLFEPFFTTKDADGTGLGLSLCSDILGQHNATIRLDESAPKGAHFEVFIPSDTGLKIANSERVQISTKRLRPLKLLMIDDEAALIRAYRRTLGRQHEIVAAYNGQEALNILQSDQSFDAIVCDLMMPVMDGIEFYEKALAGNHSLKERFIFCTGGPGQKNALQFIEDNEIILLEKPFDQLLINDALAKVLQKTSSH